MDIPQLIYGYTSGYKSASLISYVEPQEIDNGNRYRITGMAARGGTPTVAALSYMAKRMMTLPADVRLLIVVTDGQSGDNDLIEGERALTRMVRRLRKDNVIVVAAGIGSDRREVEKEFGDNFMDISDIEMMPEQLVELIKHNLVV